MAGTKKILAIVELTTTYTTNLYNGGSALISSTVKQFHFSNQTSSAVTVRIFLGASAANAAGTDLFFDHSIAANDTKDWYTDFPMTNSQFLVGGAGSNTSITLSIFGEQSVV